MKTLNETENSQQVTEELDLLKIISLFWNWCIKYIWRPFLEIIRMIVRRWYVFLAAIVLGVALAYIVPQTEPKEIYSSMQFRIYTATPADYVNRLRILAKEPRETWKEKLKLSDEAAQCLLNLWPHYVCYNTKDKTSYFIDYTDQYTFNENLPLSPFFFVVEVKTSSTEYLDEYTQAIYNYLIEDEYLHSLFYEQWHKYELRLEFIQNQLVDMRELKQKQTFVMYPPIPSRDNELSASPYDNSIEFYQLMASMKDESVSLDYFLKNINTSLSIVFPMTERSTSHVNVYSIMPKYVTFFLFLALVITFLIDFRKELAAFSKKHLS